MPKTILWAYGEKERYDAGPANWMCTTESNVKQDNIEGTMA